MNGHAFILVAASVAVLIVAGLAAHLGQDGPAPLRAADPLSLSVSRRGREGQLAPVASMSHPWGGQTGNTSAPPDTNCATRKEPAMKTMQLVSLKEMAVEAYKTGATIEFDNAQGIAFLDVSQTLTMYRARW
jgi:hypothetical protein